ncbi:hypothetical protein SAMN05443572_115135 [Myxococcus fulvus]|uniref:Uncharacterized protein n=1 Tax=Myxococcus fulvus TaxID=33 RepID=A0A511TC62_MYXFU|nr:hypothetical protein [Myxococcus fulvus]GEN11774.1 hypothetical protein MFU01_68110 [Myxococcus fulvus]SEU40471.1 hypothetical protein SAMN05443572_115135 [Myxococcus fulvus]
MAQGEAGPSVLARLVLVLLGVSFLGAAWVWGHRSEPWAEQLVERARQTVGR